MKRGGINAPPLKVAETWFCRLNGSLISIPSKSAQGTRAGAELLPQLSAIAEADCLSVRFALSDDLLNATVEGLALLLHSAET